MATLAPGKNRSDEFHGQELFDMLQPLYDHLRALKVPDLFWPALQHHSQAMGVMIDTGAIDCDNARSVLEGIAACKTCGDVLCLFPAVRPQTAQSARQLLELTWEADMEAAKRAWEIPYIVSETVLHLVGRQLRRYAQQWNCDECYAPLAALVQSSGWGKSRLICQLWREGFFVVYISCMGSRQTGFPRRTLMLADILQNPTSTEATFVALVVSIIAVLNAHADMTEEVWMQKQEESNDIQGEIHTHFQSVVRGFEDRARAIEGEVHASFQGKVGAIAGHLIREHEKYFHTCFETHIHKLQQTSRRLLLCVDEAGELQENFIKFRRSLRSIPNGSSFFSVVLGTDRKVADLAAAPKDDASARMRLATPFNAYHPVYLIGKSDIFAQAGVAEAGSSSSREIDISLDPKHVIRFGRPLWAAYYDSLEASDKLWPTIQLAKMKLLGKNINTREPGWVTRDIAVAVFSCIVGLDVVAWGTLPQKLAAKHMRTIVNITKDRRRVHTAAAVEPVLAVAAAELLHANDDAFLGVFLDKLIEVCLDGLVLEGVRGEIVAKIVLMLAMHECTKSGGYIKPVTLATFLETMFGSDIVKALEANYANVEATVFFNSFTGTSLPPSQKLLNAAFARCTAITPRRNGQTFDFALPVRVGSSAPVDRHALSSGAKKQVLLGSSQLTVCGAAILGQVKNVRGECSMEHAIENLQNEERLNTCAELFFQIGHRGDHNVAVDHTTVVAYGLDCFKHLQFGNMKAANVLDKLKLLSRTCEDVFKDASVEEQAALQEMIPMGYDKNQFLDDNDAEDDYKMMSE